MATTHLYGPTDAEPTVDTRCQCGATYYDANYRGEPCRQCGELL
jgi:hypothetical protein